MTIPTPLLAAALFALSLLSVVGLTALGQPVPSYMENLLVLFAGAIVGTVAPATVSLRRKPPER